MFNSLLFLFVNLAIFWVMHWAWKQDDLQVQENLTDSDKMD